MRLSFRPFCILAMLLWSEPSPMQGRGWGNESLTAGSLPRVVPNVQATGDPGLDEVNANPIFIFNNITDRANTLNRALQVQSSENFEGCPAGKSASVCAVTNYTTGYFYNAVGARVMTGESALSGTILNKSTERSQAIAVGAYGIASGRASSSTWGLLNAIYDYDRAGNPQHGRVGQELDVYGYGTDDAQQRIGLDIAAGPAFGDMQATPTHVGTMLLIGPTSNDNRYAVFEHGIRLQGLYGNAIQMNEADALKAGSGYQYVSKTFSVDWSGNAVARSVTTAENISGRKFQEQLSTPLSSSAPCIAGQFTDDYNFHYVCVARNKWKRAALNSF